MTRLSSISRCGRGLLAATLAVVIVSLPVRHARAADATPDAVANLFKSALPDSTGTQRPLAALRGKTVVLNFWASWCGPCVEEMPALSRLHQELASKNIAVAGIGVDSATNVSTFLSKVSVSYPIFVAGFGGADLARQFGDNVGALPFTVVIGTDDRVRYSKLGPLDMNELRRQLGLN